MTTARSPASETAPRTACSTRWRCALQLDDAERAHLVDLARAAQPIAPAPRRRPAKHRIRPSVQQLLDALTGAAAHIGNDRLDILGANALGRALFPAMLDGHERPNAARFVFLDARARDFYLDWDRIFELNDERLELVFDAGLTIFTYTADPGTRSADALAPARQPGRNHRVFGRDPESLSYSRDIMATASRSRST